VRSRDSGEHIEYLGVALRSVVELFLRFRIARVSQLREKRFDEDLAGWSKLNRRT